MDYNINDVADYIILRIKSEDNAFLINLKLQKLLFYIQAWSYGINHTNFFIGEFQAWIHGPINIEIYDRFKDTKTLYSSINLNDVINPNVMSIICGKNAMFIEYILENYAQFSAVELEEMIKNERYWIDTRKGFKQNQKCDKIIDPLLIESYYKNKWENIKK